jgi:hypothetical protein
MKKLWLRNALLTIPLIAKSMLLPHEINRLVHKLEKISFPRGNVSFIGNMKAALYIVEAGKIQIAVTDGDGVVNTFDQVRANVLWPLFYHFKSFIIHNTFLFCSTVRPLWRKLFV